MMVLEHDFTRFPELTLTQAQKFYFESPHKQIFESFTAKVTKVKDGDTINVRWRERSFDFPIRLANIAAPELNEEGGHAAQSWLEARLLGKEIDIIIDPNKKVEKWGRLLATLIHGGINVAEEEIMMGLATTWEGRKDGVIPKW